MKLKNLVLAVLSLCFVGALLPAAAHAEAAEASVETTTTDDILWVEADLTAAEADSLKIRISAPGKKTRKAFQTCSFNFSGAGTYRCGIDVAEGSIASKLTGTWTSKVIVDGAVTAQAEFTL